MSLDVLPRHARLGVQRAAAAGLACGVAWGVAARIWMRLISSDPGFSWSGTGFILAVTGVGGLALGLMYGARRAGRSSWRRFLIVLCVPAFMGPGFSFLPALLAGGLLFAARRPWLRWVGGAAIVAGVVLTMLVDRSSDIPADPWLLGGGFGVLSVALAAGASELYRPDLST